MGQHADGVHVDTDPYEETLHLAQQLWNHHPVKGEHLDQCRMFVVRPIYI